mmetsp:Transcript_63275/g.169168  ORF Transcript_63275/g.169168 Transcript_63275/m.169168 type:complete len:257 (-) Transcript_63275:444-1214(-)
MKLLMAAQNCPGSTDHQKSKYLRLLELRGDAATLLGQIPLQCPSSCQSSRKREAAAMTASPSLLYLEERSVGGGMMEICTGMGSYNVLLSKGGWGLVWKAQVAHPPGQLISFDRICPRFRRRRWFLPPSASPAPRTRSGVGSRAGHFPAAGAGLAKWLQKLVDKKRASSSRPSRCLRSRWSAAAPRGNQRTQQNFAAGYVPTQLVTQLSNRHAATRHHAAHGRALSSASQAPRAPLVTTQPLSYGPPRERTVHRRR